LGFGVSLCSRRFLDITEPFGKLAALMAEPKENLLMEKIVSLCKRRGFIFQSSEIYGGINGFWDYGPLGAELKRNVKDLWWRWMTRDREDVVGLEATIIMHPQIWRASGHVDTFSDPMSTCRHCKKLIRADQVWDLLAAQEWVQSLAAVADVATQSFDAPTISRWGERKGKHLAPNLALVRNPNVTLSWLAERSKDSTTKPLSAKEFYQYVATEQLPVTGLITPCPYCGGELTEPRPFNLMFESWAGPVQSDENKVYLRPETAQAIFAQFKNVLDSSRQKVPFGIGQIGKAFRNEITPRNYTFRSREFEQMELEFFIRPDEATETLHGSVASVAAEGHPGEPQPSWGWQAWHRYWVEERMHFYEHIGLPRATLGFHIQAPEELAHYARATVDILYKFPFSKEENGEVKGDELEGIAARGDFDLSQHEKFSGKPLVVFDDEVRGAWSKLSEEKRIEMRDEFIEEKTRVNIDKKKMEPGDAAAAARKEGDQFFDRLSKGQYIPHVIEPSAGVDRLILALICNAYTEDEAPDEKGKMETRVVMKFHPRIAPIKVAVFPLLKNRPELVAKAREIYDLLRRHMPVFYDDGGAIGRRYRRQDEAGTPFGVTIDFDTLGEKGPELKDTVTLRERDTMKQERVAISELLPRLLESIR
jgi:glycyl-tRNA synthetase